MVKFQSILLLGQGILSEKLFFGRTDEKELELCGEFTGAEGSIQTQHPHKLVFTHILWLEFLKRNFKFRI